MSEGQKAPNDEAADLPAADWRQAAAALFDQELWLLGYDIRRPEGNLLIEAGCRRIAAPEGSDLASCYQTDLATGERLTLRGFGLLCEDRADSCGVFLFRDAFKVGWFDSAPVELPWKIDDLPADTGVPAHARERAARLIHRAATWIADYEQTVVEAQGIPYRDAALKERNRPVAAIPADTPARWRQIAHDVARRPELLTEAPKRKRKRRRGGKPLTLR